MADTDTIGTSLVFITMPLDNILVCEWFRGEKFIIYFFAFYFLISSLGNFGKWSFDSVLSCQLYVNYSLEYRHEN